MIQLHWCVLLSTVVAILQPMRGYDKCDYFVTLMCGCINCWYVSVRLCQLQFRCALLTLLRLPYCCHCYLVVFAWVTLFLSLLLYVHHCGYFICVMTIVFNDVFCWLLCFCCYYMAPHTINKSFNNINTWGNLKKKKRNILIQKCRLSLINKWNSSPAVKLDPL